MITLSQGGIEMKKTLIMLGLALLVIGVLACVVYRDVQTKTYDPDDIDTYIDPSNVVFEGELKQLSVGMTYAEVIQRIGKGNRVVGSGLFILEYKCSNGQYLLIWLQHDAENSEDSYYLDAFRLVDEPWPQ